MTRILIIEDDRETSDEIAGFLILHGYDVITASTGDEGLALALGTASDVLIVDRMLPGLDGLTLLGRLRQAGIRTPALVLSALNAVDDRVRGLRAGGDDYVGKPFALLELTARVESLLRRPLDGPETMLRVGELELDLMLRKARRGRRDLELLPREFALLEYLVRRAGQTVTRSMLFEDVWNYRFTPRSNLVDVHIGRLRRKLEAQGEAELIRSVRGAGFVLELAP